MRDRSDRNTLTAAMGSVAGSACAQHAGKQKHTIITALSAGMSVFGSEGTRWASATTHGTSPSSVSCADAGGTNTRRREKRKPIVHSVVDKIQLFFSFPFRHERCIGSSTTKPLFHLGWVLACVSRTRGTNHVVAFRCFVVQQQFSSPSVYTFFFLSFYSAHPSLIPPHTGPR